jgi:hypothetical protein
LTADKIAADPFKFPDAPAAYKDCG